MPSREIRSMGVPGMYYPVVLELDTSSTKLTGYPLIVTSTGPRLYATRRSLSAASKVDGFAGMFLLGAIPISLLSGILFETEQDMLRFSKSSPDLWFPKDLYRVIQGGEEESPLTGEDLESFSMKAEKLAKGRGNAKEALQIIDERLRQKASLYFALEATEGWRQGFVKTNLDERMAKGLDEKLKLKAAMRSACKQARIPAPLLFKTSEPIDEWEPFLEATLKAQILTFSKDAQIGRDGFELIKAACLNALPEHMQDHYRQGFDIIDAYCYKRTEMDPDQALQALSGKGTLKALLFLLDAQRNAEFLRNAARRLDQEEKRLCYTLFGLLRGMDEVEGERKGNRSLEYQMERVTLNTTGIVKVELSKDHPFLKDGATSTFGLVPAVSWVTEEEDIRRALLEGSDVLLQKAYKKFLKGVLPEAQVYAFENPIEVSRSFQSMAEVEAFYKEMKKTKQVLQSAKVREYLADKKAFSSLFRKKEKEMQAFCRGFKP